MEITRIDDLGKFYAPSPVIGSAQDGSIYFQRFPAGFITNAMCGNSKTVFIGGYN
jgi:hypothetical protein